jgi:hypothetical protein
MPFADLPARHEHSAPCFDDTRPKEVERYFVDLQHLLAANSSSRGQNEASCHQIPQICWDQKALEDNACIHYAGQTYKEFKTEILSLYPSTSTDHTFSIQDLDMLIGKQVWVGIISTNDITDYYCQFLLILHYLISKNCLSSIDQS